MNKNIPLKIYKNIFVNDIKSYKFMKIYKIYTNI